MPLGNQRWPQEHGPVIRGPVYAPPLGEGGLRARGSAPAASAVDAWRNFTLPANATAWSAGKTAVMDFGAPVTVLEVFVLGADPIFISWKGPPSSTPGTYELYHPGRGQLVEVVPNIQQLWIATASGATPSARIEVVGKGGLYGVPSGVVSYGA